MKIPTYKVKDFLNSVSNLNIASCLLHGPNNGLKQILADNIAQNILNYDNLSAMINSEKVIRLDNDLIANNPEILYNEVFNVNLWCKQKVVRVRSANNKITNIIAEILKNIDNKIDTFLILISSDSEAINSLVNLYNNNINLASIGCYVEERDAVVQVIIEFFKQRNIKYEDEAINTIAECIPGDRMMLISELQKLELYADESNPITQQIVEQVISEFKIKSIDVLIDAFAVKDLQTSLDALQIIFQDDFSNIAVVRILSAHFMKLRIMLLSISNNNTIADVLKKERIFFKRAKSFTKQLQTWSIAGTEMMLANLLKLEAALKRYPERVGNMMIYNFITIFGEVKKSN